MKVVIQNKSDQIIFSNLNTYCRDCYTSCKSISQIVSCCPEYSSRFRHGIISNHNGTIFVCSSEKDDIVSSRRFKDKLKLYSEIIGEIHSLKSGLMNDIKELLKRLLHNVISINGHNIQEIYALVSQDLLTQNLDYQITAIKNTVIQNPKETALTFLRIAKNNLALKMEFSVFQKLYDSSAILDKKLHPIRKVLLNTLHSFFQDFNDKGIHIEIGPCDQKINLDYETFQVGLYHLIDNASKYCEPFSKVFISFENDSKYFSIVFNMHSTKINPNELKDIFEDGYSGVNAKYLKKAGTGLGLGIIKRVLELNHAKLLIHIDVKGDTTYYGNVPFENNIFEIKFIKT